MDERVRSTSETDGEVREVTRFIPDLARETDESVRALVASRVEATLVGRDLTAIEVVLGDRTRQTSASLGEGGDRTRNLIE